MSRIFVFLCFLILYPSLSVAKPLVMFPASYEYGKEKAYVEKIPKYLFEVGKMHYYGVKHEGTGELFVKPNMPQSLDDFKSSYNLGYKREPARFLAHMHFNGEGTTKNTKEALKYYSEVLANGKEEDRKEALSLLKENEREIQRLDSNFFKEHNILTGFQPQNTSRVNTRASTSKVPDQLTPEQFKDFKKKTWESLDSLISLARSYVKNPRSRGVQYAMSGTPKALPKAFKQSKIEEAVTLWIQKANSIKFKLLKQNADQEILKRELIETLRNFPLKHILRGVELKYREYKNGVLENETRLGSGFFYSSKYIITNYHVVAQSTDITKKGNTGQTIDIGLRNGSERKATIVYYDCDSDLALLELQEKEGGESIRNQDLFTEKEIKIFLKIQKDSHDLITEEEVTAALMEQITKIPLGNNASTGNTVEYLNLYLSEIETGRIEFINLNLGILRETKIVSGYSGGGIYYDNKLLCVTQGGSEKRDICISSSQIKRFVNSKSEKTKPLCECTNHLIVTEIIMNFLKNNERTQREMILSAFGLAIENLASLESAKRFINQTNDSSIKSTKIAFDTKEKMIDIIDKRIKKCKENPDCSKKTNGLIGICKHFFTLNSVIKIQIIN